MQFFSGQQNSNKFLAMKEEPAFLLVCNTGADIYTTQYLPGIVLCIILVNFHDCPMRLFSLKYR